LARGSHNKWFGAHLGILVSRLFPWHVKIEATTVCSFLSPRSCSQIDVLLSPSRRLCLDSACALAKLGTAGALCRAPSSPSPCETGRGRDGQKMPGEAMQQWTTGHSNSSFFLVRLEIFQAELPVTRFAPELTKTYAAVASPTLICSHTHWRDFHRFLSFSKE